MTTDVSAGCDCARHPQQAAVGRLVKRPQPDSTSAPAAGLAGSGRECVAQGGAAAGADIGRLDDAPLGDEARPRLEVALDWKDAV